jgi:ubiquinone/menaquinone biosynthesis C-methylase UbiE
MADVTTSDCCSTDAQATCCEPDAKDACCGTAGGCGCAEGQQDIRETVREKYAAIAQADPEASLGCGVPTAVADLHAGETVLDLGSGAGADVLISAGRVGPTGRAIGLDMTDEMLELARRNAAEAGAANVEFLKGHIEDIPLPAGAVDVVISNCVINLSGDKPRVLREAARVLRPGGRFAVSDVLADDDMDDATKADMAAWTGCIAGALTRAEYERHLRDAGFEDVEIRETHRVHEHAASAIIRATKPSRSCALDEEALAVQLRRLAAIGGHIVAARQTGPGVTVRLDDDLDDAFLHETLETERGCCPFLGLTWDEAARELTITSA